MVPQLLLPFLLLLAPQGGHGCHGPELDRALVLAKVRALFLDALGPPAVTGEGGDPGVRRLPRRHALGGSVRRGPDPEEDVSQAILFPASGASCENEPAAGELAQEARPETTPFLVAHTRTKPPTGGERSRRSAPPIPWPWSPAALRLLQRPPEELSAHADCHRASLNISFQELGWDRWIVHPPSFIFHYCHGGCGLHTSPDLSLTVPGALPTPVQPLSLLPGAQPCCAALPGTMRPLRVRTTSDGGYSFKYETVPNLLTQHCACI
ncbi:inhibin alpha chain isoform X2 [Tupaia chinensis]|uniref:inhibin alpha chain isoform X2 n=1 Tax=Tupaia chinensis TaxID=246437 RepID=UPI0003C91B94|nr:inhibin alpha chain isoform X2 [Tupaia chinensis]